MVKIAVIGSCSIDLTVEAGKRPAAGETIIGSRLIVSPGGKGANQAVAAARLGAQVHMIGCVGDDAYGTMIINNLKTTTSIPVMSASCPDRTAVLPISSLPKATTVLSSSKAPMIWSCPNISILPGTSLPPQTWSCSSTKYRCPPSITSSANVQRQESAYF